MKKQTTHKMTCNQPNFIPVLEWEGWVEEIDGDTFYARLVNLSDENKIPREIAEFCMDDLSNSDQKKLELGSILKWELGTEMSPSGQRKHASRVHLRQFSEITKKDLERIDNEVDELLKWLKLHDSSKSK